MKLMKNLGALVFAGAVGLGLAGNGYSADEIIIKYRTHSRGGKCARIFRQSGKPHIDFEKAWGGTAIKRIYERNEYAIDSAIEILKAYGDYCELRDVIMIDDRTDNIDLVLDVLKARGNRFSIVNDNDKHRIIEDLFGRNGYPGYSINKERYLESNDKHQYENDREIYVIGRRYCY